MKDKLVSVLKFVAFFVFIYLVIDGQRTVGRENLLFQLIGVGGLILLLWDYNRKFS